MSSDRHLELHTDGAAFAAIHITGQGNTPPEISRFEVDAERTVCGYTRDVERWLLGLIDRCADHAVHTGAGGDFELQAQIITAQHNDQADLPVREQQPMSTFLIEDIDSFPSRVVPGSNPVASTSLARATTPFSVTRTPAALVQVAAELANEIFAEFGQLPTASFLTLDRKIKEQACTHPWLKIVKCWAGEAGILI